MAKGQKKSNREAKKPKKAAGIAIESPASFPLKAPSGAAQAKKKR